MHRSSQWGSFTGGARTRFLAAIGAVAIVAGGMATGVVASESPAQAAPDTQLQASAAADPTLFSWGRNGSGRLGNGSTIDDSVPVVVTAGANVANSWRVAAAGSNHACAIGADDSLYCWGGNNRGQLGNGTATDDSVPVAVPSAASWISVSAENFTTCAIASDGTGYCWGNNSSGQMGDDTQNFDPNPSPVAVLPGDNTSGRWTTLSVGQEYTCGINGAGAAYCWGANGKGQLGNGSTTRSFTPVAVSNGANTTGLWHSISAGNASSNQFTCGIDSAGAAYCWGDNNQGQLGIGTRNSNPNPLPVAVSDGANATGLWQTVSAGREHACAIGADDSAYCWGDNSYGQLGNGTTADDSVPVRVSLPGNAPVRDIGSGEWFSCAATDDSVYCWGRNSYGQLGNGTTVDDSAPVAVTTTGVLAGQSITAISVGEDFVIASAVAGAPGTPTAAAGDAQASLVWSTPVAGGLITGYEIEWSSDGGASWTTANPNTGTNATSSVVTGLTNGTSYIFRVSAINSSGTGAWSASSNAVTPSGSTPPVAPSAPRDVTVEAGDASGTVSWQAPASPGSFPVSTYQATTSTDGKSCLVTAPALTCEITGLTNDTTYTVSVRALNGAGWSAYSEPSAAFTPGTRITLVLNQGTRTADGRHDRIRTTGTSTGIPDGSRLTPYIRYGNRGAFIEGKATIVVQLDGSFRWTREIRKSRAVTGYVTWKSTESNRVTWLKIR